MKRICRMIIDAKCKYMQLEYEASISSILKSIIIDDKLSIELFRRIKLN